MRPLASNLSNLDQIFNSNENLNKGNMERNFRGQMLQQDAETSYVLDRIAGKKEMIQGILKKKRPKRQIDNDNTAQRNRIAHINRINNLKNNQSVKYEVKARNLIN